MGFTVSKNALLTKLSIAAHIINGRNILPILDYFLCETLTHEAGESPRRAILNITASDTISSIQCTLDIKVNSEPYCPKFTLPAKLILETLKSIPEQPITFIINSYSIKVTYNGGFFELKSENPDEYPIMKIDEYVEIPIPSSTLLNGIKSVQPFCGEDSLRPVLSNVYISFTAGKTFFVATDTLCLALLAEPNKLTKSHQSIMLNKKIANIIKIILQQTGEEEIILQSSSKKIAITSTSFTIITRQAEGNYPNYNAVIPVENDKKATLNTAGLKSALQRVSVFTNQNTKLVVFDFKSNTLKLTCENFDYNLSAEEILLSEDSNMDTFRIGFKLDNIINAISAVETDRMTIDFLSPERASVIKPIGIERCELLYLVMPLIIRD